MSIRKVFSFLNGAPGIAVALLAAGGAFQLYVHTREKAAVERARWTAVVDSLHQAMVAEQLAAAFRDSARVDSIRQYQAEVLRVKRVATQAAATARSASEALHQLVDSNAVVRAYLDTLEQAHATEVTSLYQAMAYADSVHQVDLARIADRDRQLSAVRADLERMTERASKFERDAHPGALATILRSPLTHLGFAGLGYALGKKA